MQDLYIRIDSLPDGAMVFRTAAKLASHLMVVIGRMRKLRPSLVGLDTLAALQQTCELALGPGVGEGDPCAEARRRLILGTEGSRCRQRLQFFRGHVATWED